MPINSTAQVGSIIDAGTTPNTQHPNAPITVAINSTNTSKQPIRNDDCMYEDASSVRNSSTPVVSLLSLDQQQEKDFLSLQGGRRRKPTNPPSLQGPPIPPRSYPSNGYMNPYGPIAYHSLPLQPFNAYNANLSHNRQTYSTGYQRRLNGFDNRSNAHKKKRIYDGNKPVNSNDHSSRSSLRTDSNSSASCVDENKNEEKSHRTAVNTPPPAPYSPLANPFKMFNLSNYHTANNTSRNSNHPKYHSNRPNYHTNNNNYNRIESGGKISGTNCTNPSNLTSDSQPTLNSQVHVATSQALISTPSAQGFSGGATSGARRSRRSLRRGGGTGVNEIGAGDAPLLSDVGGDVCKKLETLKL